MAYLHIDNLYKNQEVLLFKECYVMEKIHGTSAHVAWNDGHIRFFSGGAKYENFKALFNEEELAMKCSELGVESFILYGEAYGGKEQGMRDTYGDKLKFIVFDVKIGDMWLDVLKAYKFAIDLGFQFVWFTRCGTNVKELDQWRDGESRQAIVNDMGDGKKMEGIVIRPLIELRKNNGERIIAKHKRDDFSEVKTPRKIDPDKLERISEAKNICIEWVTENRLSNILSHIEKELDIKDIPIIIKSMVADVLREGKDEIVESKELIKIISRETALMIKRRLQFKLKNKE